MRSYSSDQPCKVILWRFRLNHLKRQDSDEVPGIREDISSQLSLTLCISETVMESLSQCLHISQMSILRSQILQFLLSLRVLAILSKWCLTFRFFSMFSEWRSQIQHFCRLPPQFLTALKVQNWCWFLLKIQAHRWTVLNVLIWYVNRLRNCFTWLSHLTLSFLHFKVW